jgi:TRAP transporter TAXI family solute receptor
MRRILTSLLLLTFLTTVIGCSGGNTPGDGEQTTGPKFPKNPKFISLGSAPNGGTFFVIGQNIAEGVNNAKGDYKWQMEAKSTKGSQENIRRLSKGELNVAISNAAISYFAARGESGWEDKHDIQAVCTMAPNVAMFLVKEDTGIRDISSLRGKSVVMGPAGAGFEQFVIPILNAYGVQEGDLEILNATQNDAVDMLGDGRAQAVFLGGGVPTSSVTRACSEHDVVFLPYSEPTRGELIEKYPFFRPHTVPQDKYDDLTADYEGLDVGSMHLITHANMPEEAIYEFTKTLWEARAKIAEGHPAAKAINETNAVRNTGIDFHPGAIRFYKEIDIWPKDADNTSETE